MNVLWVWVFPRKQNFERPEEEIVDGGCDQYELGITLCKVCDWTGEGEEFKYEFWKTSGK